MDTMQLIETKKAEATKRVTKLRAQLEAAEADLRNLEITAETLTRLGLNPEIETSVPRGQSYNQVLRVLGDSEFDAKTPKEIHDALMASGASISQDNVRTILSRYKDRFESSEGRYWRRVEEAPESAPNLPGDDDLLGSTEEGENGSDLL
jgi:hypothetical protein